VTSGNTVNARAVAYDRAMGSPEEDRARPHGLRRRVDAVAAVVGVALFAPAAAIARDGTVGNAEATVFRAINGLPEALYPFANAAQFLGVLGVGPVVALAALVWRRPRLALAALVVTGLKLVVERRIVWPLVFRTRPGTSTPGAIVRGDTPITGASFVSGHVIVVTALAWVVMPYLPARWRWAPWTVVAVVALARIYLGAHNPLDVVGGVGMGLAVGGVTNLVVGVSAPVEEDVAA
jgi:undecaprenyl-diphosphatase